MNFRIGTTLQYSSRIFHLPPPTLWYVVSQPHRVRNEMLCIAICSCCHLHLLYSPISIENERKISKKKGNERIKMSINHKIRQVHSKPRHFYHSTIQFTSFVPYTVSRSHYTPSSTFLSSFSRPVDNINHYCFPYLSRC